MSAEQKRLEKLSKRFKPVLDEKQKLKPRFKSLESFLEFATEQDVIKTFQQNDVQTYYVVSEILHYKIGKIREANTLIEIISIFYKLVQACHLKISQGWNHNGIVRIIETLLQEGNHVKVRKQGLKILLFILSRDTSDSQFLNLFKNIVPVTKIHGETVPDLWECVGKEDHGALVQRKEIEFVNRISVLARRKESVVPSVHTVSEANPVTVLAPGVVIPKETTDTANYLELYKDILEEVHILTTKMATDANFADFSTSELLENLESEGAIHLKNLWGLIKTVIFKDLFPQVCTELKICNGKPGPFPLCPRDIMQVTLEFLVKYARMPLELDENSRLADQSCAILHTLIFTDEENQEIANEVIRQACIARMGDLALQLILNLVYFNESLIHTNDQQSTELIEKCKKRQKMFNIKIRRYFSYLKYLLTEKPMPVEVEYNMYKDMITFFRYLIVASDKHLEEESKDQIARYLLDFQYLLCQPKNQIGVSIYGPEIKSLMAETVWICWIRSTNKKEILWKELEEHSNKVNQTPEVTKIWSALLIQLTSMLTNTVYGISSNMLKDDPNRAKRVRIKTREIAASQIINDTPKKEREVSAQDVQRPSSGKHKKSDDNESHHTLEKSGSDDALNELSAIHFMKSKSEHYSDIKELKLDAQSLLFVWKNMITVIGRIWNISKPAIHAEVIQALVHVMDHLDRIRYSQVFVVKEMPALFDFMGIFFKTCFMPIEFEKSISLSAGIICRIFCKKHDQQVQAEWHVLFQHLLKYIFNKSSEAVKYTVIQNCSKLYSLGLPGITVTIPALIETCSKMAYLSDIPSPVMKSMIQVLGSLIVFEKTYHSEVQTPYSGHLDMEQPDQPIHYHPGQNAKGLKIFEHLKYGIKDVFQNILSVHLTNRNFDYCEMVLWNFSIMLVEEFTENDLSSAKLRNEVLMILLEHISIRNVKVACAAADGLVLLAEAFPKLHLESDFVMLIIEKIIWGISEHLVKDEKGKSSLQDVMISAIIVSRLFRTLLEWLMVVPSHYVSNPNISLRITEVIEETIHVAMAGVESISEKEPPTPVDTNTAELVQLYQLMKEAAENTLIHLFHHIDNFAPRYGVATLTSQINDFPTEEKADFENHHYLSFNNHTIIGFIDLPNEKKVRILIRDPAGKFSWDMNYFYEDDSTDPKVAPPVPTERHSVPSRSTMSSFKSEGYLGSVNAIKSEDVLDLALSRFQNEHPECVYKNGIIETKNEFDEQYQNEILFQIEQEKQLPRRERNHVQEPPMAVEYFPFETARLFMSQLGLLSFDYLKDGMVHMLSKSPALFRDIKGLDKKFCRDVAKFAVIYVGPGQEDELSIFKNQQGSDQYQEFVSSLGWSVTLSDHPGYAGGLDSSIVKEGTAIYFCNSMIEIIFHDVTRMVMEDNDPKLLKKKRHIGNDHVHIIWNEHYRDYRYDTIGGDFGNAQIVVTPLPNGLYAIDTYKDETVTSFGPLQSRSVVSKECLGTLVRCTAMNAYRAAHAAGNPHATETHPFTIRKQNLEIISTRHKIVGDSYEKFMTTIFTEGIKPVSPIVVPSEASSPAI